MPDRLLLPPPVPEPEPPGLPIVGALAPLLVAGLLFAVVRTPVVLLVAVLSPVLAVAQLVDGRLAARRRRRHDLARRSADLDELEREAAGRLAARAAAAQRSTPSSALLVADRGWTRRPEQQRVVLGSAPLPTEPVLEGRPSGERERRMLTDAARLPGAPVTVDPATRVSVTGAPPLATAFARAIAVQRAACGLALPEGDAARTIPDADLEVDITGPGSARVVRAHGAAASLAGLVFAPGLVTAASLARLRSALPGAAVPGLPELIALPPGRGGLAARFAVGPSGPVELDLVADGPHAVVAGTTGSGKSALLTAWVLALAAAHPPSVVGFLLVDCKGGAAFDPLAGLPHVLGVVTDLDPEGTERVVQSLTAELHRRERVLREAGLPDVTGSGEPRLVLVVDEFRALLETRPALAAVFVDVAARGRSLGLHLVLCTQRPAGSIRDELLANCGLRISLRVHDVSDSVAVVGTGEAARLAGAPPGTAVVRTADGAPARITVGRLTGDAVRSIAGAAARSATGPVRRPWLEPLPGRLPLVDLLPERSHGRVVLGRLDLPAEQRQPLAEWNPQWEPRLLVAGRTGSGRSSLLAVVAAQLGCDVVPDDAACAWDRIHDDAAPLLLDDTEALLDRLGPHADAAVDRLIVRLRAPACAPTVLCCRGPGAWAGARIRAVAGLADRILLLGLDLDDHLALGGARGSWQERARPGRAVWDGAIAQLAVPSGAAPRTAVPPAPLLDLGGGSWLLATAAPAERLAQLLGAGVRAAAPGGGDRATVLVASPAGWQAEWALLGRLLAVAPVLVDRIPPADARALTGRASVLPPVTAPDEVVLVPPEGQPGRRRLPR